jgi:predicted negative regulator of RcsB-dependent stress response
MSATVHEHMGDLQERRGQTEQARAAWQKALSLSDDAAQTARLTEKINMKAKK